MRTVAVIQARMGSTRLPGKVLRRLCGATVLAHVVRRVRACSLLDDVIVATTVDPRDDILVDEVRRLGAHIARGSEADVLDRYVQASTSAEVVVRVTADCPLFDPDLLTRMLEVFGRAATSGHPLDYMSNTFGRRTFPRGLDAEVFTRAALLRAHREARQEYEREHVTPFLYQHPELFALAGFPGELDLSHHRWTLDTEEDFQLLDAIFARLCAGGALFSTAAVLALLREQPQLAAVNAGVRQKGLTD